jgi:hypothetical protein
MNRGCLIKINAIAAVLFISTFSSIANAQLGDLLKAFKGLGAELENAGSQNPSTRPTPPIPTPDGDSKAVTTPLQTNTPLPPTKTQAQYYAEAKSQGCDVTELNNEKRIELNASQWKPYAVKLEKTWQFNKVQRSENTATDITGELRLSANEYFWKKIKPDLPEKGLRCLNRECSYVSFKSNASERIPTLFVGSDFSFPLVPPFNSPEKIPELCQFLKTTSEFIISAVDNDYKPVALAENRATDAKNKADQLNLKAGEGFGNWAQYSKREKNIVEQTLNYSTCGNTDGEVNCHWRKSDSDACVARRFPPDRNLDNVNNTINIRNFNQTAFSIYSKPVPREPAIFYEYTDGAINIKGFFITAFARAPSMDRIKNAWGLAFKQCPGKKSAF